jgi:hypothetical protein
VDPEILATGLGRCATKDETTDQNPPHVEGGEERGEETMAEAEGHEILHLVGLAGSLEYFTCHGRNSEDVRTRQMTGEDDGRRGESGEAYHGGGGG